MRESDDELNEIKREIIESRALVIKTNNLTSALASDLRGIAKRQDTYERRLVWNSAAAYAIFVIVLFGAVKFAWDARIEAIRAETEHRSSENERLRKEVREFQKRDEDRARAEAKAAQYYDAIRQARRVDVVEGYEAVRREPLTKAEQAVFADAALKAANELAGQAYLHGLEKARVKRWQEAASSFEESLKYKGDSAIAAQAKLALASAYRQLGRPGDAVPLLTAIAEGAADREVQDDALHLLAYCQAELGAFNDAKNTWRALLRRFPDSHFAPEGRLQLAQLNLMH